MALAKKVKLEVELGNVAMLTVNDVADAVAKSFASWMDGAEGVTMLRLGYGKTISDDNGNTVGKWEVVQA